MEVPGDKMIILFDGVCNLCNGAVDFVIRKDRADRFRFAALQSDIGRQLASSRHMDMEKVDSIILIEPGVAYYLKSDAALEIARHLKGYRALPYLLGWIPRPLRDAVYDLVARYRYRWFGKRDACRVPTPELMSKFLS